MIGPYEAKVVVNDYLQRDLPKRLIRFRNLWQRSADELPTPKTYHAFAPPSTHFATDSLPAIYTVVISTQSVQRVGWTVNNDPEYRVTYLARTYVWVTGQSEDDATRMRDNLMTVMRTAFLDDQCFNDHSSSLSVKFDEDTLTEEFSDLIPVGGERFTAGGYLSYELAIEEVVQRDMLGVVSDVELTVEPLDWAFLRG